MADPQLSDDLEQFLEGPADEQRGEILYELDPFRPADAPEKAAGGLFGEVE